jgi:8-oxo-dGTP pyrophosphatase MutT (NUDIX family)
MTRLVFGDRISRQAALRPSASAAILNATRDKVLLTRRADNGQWCLPGGGMDPGESIAETCERETREETGLEVRVKRLIGVYTSPDWVLEYAGGNRFQVVGFHFEAEATGGRLSTSDETTGAAYFSPAEIEALDLMSHHRERILDSFLERQEAVVR